MTKVRLVFLLTMANRRLHQWVQTNGDGRASRHGVLMAIRDDPLGTPFSEVARALGLGTSTLSGLVDRMATSGLLVRTADAVDGRASRLSLTDAGRTARKAAVDQAQSLNARLREGFSEQELEAVARWLTAVDDRLSSLPQESSAATGLRPLRGGKA